MKKMWGRLVLLLTAFVLAAPWYSAESSQAVFIGLPAWVLLTIGVTIVAAIALIGLLLDESA